MRSNSINLRLALSASALTLAALAVPQSASAATCIWGGGAGTWSPAGGWSGCSVPSQADDVVITAGGSIVNITGITARAGTVNLGTGNALNVINSDFYVHGGTFTNNGTFTLGGGAGTASFLSGSGNVTFGGTGTIVLNDLLGGARIYNGGFIFGSGQTVRGSGQLGINQGIFSNAGLISADVSGRNLSIDVSGGNGGLNGSGFGTGNNAGFYNTGIMQASGGGSLSFEGGLYENGVTGEIRALAGSFVNLNADSRIVGGTLTSVGTGRIRAIGTSQYLQNVTLSAGSNLLVQSNDLRANTMLTNNGTITLGGSAGTASLINEGGTLTINGSGNIVLDNSLGGARIYNGHIVFGSNQSLQGAGQLGINQTLVTNNGLFSANSGSNLSIDVSGGSGGVNGGGLGTGSNAGLLNNNIMEATGGSTISFEGGLYENATGGIIRATNNSTINLGADSRILNGTLSSDATSAIRAVNTSQYLTNVTLAAGSNLLVQSNNLYLNTALGNNGTITVGGATGTATLLNEGGTLAINGTGTIVLDSSLGAARIYGGNITFGAGQTVQGAGQLGINQTTFTINNVFSANAGSSLDIDVSGGNGGLNGGGIGTGNNAGLYNTSTIQATGGSSLNFGGGLYENSATGVIQALSGSFVNLGADSRIVGGTLTSVGTGLIRTVNASQYLTGVTLSSGSNILVQNDNLYANTSLTNNGTITLGGATGTAAMIVEGGGTLNLTGTGRIVFDNSQGAAWLYSGHVIFGSNHSLQGSGSLGINQTLVTNSGLLSLSGGGTLSLDVSGGNGGLNGGGIGTGSNAGLLNNNIIEVTGGSTLSIEGGRYENAANGVIRAVNGSTINLNSDSRIVNGTLSSDATSAIRAVNASQYLTNVTLAAGSNLLVRNNNLYAGGTLTNNGTMTLGGAAGTAALLAEGGALAINGTGTIVLDNSAGAAWVYSGGFTFGSGQTIRGSGQVGVNQSVITNNGLISADAGTGISIDVSGGSGGLNGGGVGTGSNAGMLNGGTVQGANGRALSLEGGLYQNTATGAFGALGAGSSFVMNGDANLANIQAGGVLSLGRYFSSTTGAASTLNLRGAGSATIATIGTATAGTDTVVTLSGANSVFNVTNFGTGVNTSLDSTLTNVAQSGRLEVLGGRNLTIVAGGGAFANAGIVQLGGGTFGASSYANSGLTTGFGTIGSPIANLGIVEAAGGTLATGAITGTAGTIRSLSGATLDISGGAADSTAGFLANNGNLALGSRNVIVTSDYTNGGFGTGNAFNAHANVSGTGLILAAGATMDLSGPALSGNILNVGNVRTGGSSSTTLTITNNGTLTTLRGAVQNGNAPSVALSGADWVIGPNGGSTNVTISYTGLAAGSLSGQTLNVVNNFDNVADATIGLAGNIYQVAQAGAQPATIALGARRVGDAGASNVISIANVAPVTPGFNETLTANASVGGAFLLNGAASATASNVAAGSFAPITLSLGTGTAGAFSNTVNIANTSNAVAGSGLTDLTLAGQSIAVSGNVYALAVANLSGNTVNFGTVRQGSTSPTGSLTVTNGANGALSDTLVTSLGSLPSVVTGTAPGALAAGASGSASFSLNTATAGAVNAGGTLNFVSRNPEMADAALASQNVTFTGTVTELAIASLFKSSGSGTFGGAGTSYTLDFGSLASNSGTVSTDFGILNGNSGQSFSELLGGSFTQGAGTGYSFMGNSFTGLAGGSQNIGNLLSFDTTGLSNGTYTKLVTFNGFSQYPTLSNFALSPITVSITATVTGANPNPNPGAVPEPATWMMMILGFGLLGGTMRRKRTGGEPLVRA